MRNPGEGGGGLLQPGFRSARVALLPVVFLGRLCGQTPVEDLHFRSDVLPRLHDLEVQGLSSDYLFAAPSPRIGLSSKLEFRLPWNADQHTFLFGPAVHFKLGKRFEFSGWALAGNGKRFALVQPLASPVDATPPHFGLPGMPVSQSLLNGANEKMISLGSALDYHVTDHVTYRPVQLDLLKTQQLKGAPRRDVRWSTGVRVDWGK